MHMFVLLLTALQVQHPFRGIVVASHPAFLWCGTFLFFFWGFLPAYRVQAHALSNGLGFRV